MKLKQCDKTIDQYAVEFNRLSRFAPALIAEEEDKASQFQQGLKFEIQKQLSSHQLRTYSEVLIYARQVERIIMKDTRSNGHNRPFQQVAKGPQARAIGAPPAKRPAQQANTS